MAKTKHYVAAVLIEGKHLLFVRELDADLFPKTGFAFPGCEAKENASYEAILSKHLAKVYSAEVRVLQKLNPVAHLRADGGKSVIHPFLCQVVKPFVFPTVEHQHRYVAFSDLDKVFLDPCDRILAEKCALFYPLYAAKRRVIPLAPSEKAQANFFLESLLYFRSRMSDGDVSDFSLLLRSEIDFAGIQAAYRYLLRLYSLDYNEYLEILDYQKEHGGL